MNLLVDTHAFVWLATSDRRLSRTARAALLDPSNTVYVSVVSEWEFALKTRDPDFARLPSFESLVVQSGFTPIGLSYGTPRLLASLPWHHRDPYDRILIAQALFHGFAMVSGDRQIARYDIDLVW